MGLVELPGFEEKVRRHTWRGNVLPVLYEGERHCSHCTYGALVALGTFVQEALFFFGGYGEAQRRTVDVCLACGKTNVRVLETIAPTHRVRLG